MKFFSLILIISFAVLIFSSCKKPADTTITGGGKGGSAIIKVTPEFANTFIDTCTIYIKYGTHDAPANGVYDDSAICTLSAAVPVAVFSGLTTGLYYLYGIGYHSTGGHPPNLKGSQICTMSKETTTSLYLPMYPYIP